MFVILVAVPEQIGKLGLEKIHDKPFDSFASPLGAVVTKIDHGVGGVSDGGSSAEAAGAGVNSCWRTAYGWRFGRGLGGRTWCP